MSKVVPNNISFINGMSRHWSLGFRRYTDARHSALDLRVGFKELDIGYWVALSLRENCSESILVMK